MSKGLAGLIAAMCVGGLLTMLIQALWHEWMLDVNYRAEQRSRKRILKELRRKRSDIPSPFPEDW